MRSGILPEFYFSYPFRRVVVKINIRINQDYRNTSCITRAVFFLLARWAKGKENPVIPLLLSMVCAGGLGIMQKVRQSSSYEIQTGSFMLISISLASIFSLIGFLFQKKDDTPLKIQPASFICGFCYGGANLLNTMLADRPAALWPFL